MSNESIVLTPSLRQYLLDHSLREPQVLSQLREETRLKAPAQMQIAPEQGQFMRLLLQLMQAKKVLEIGTFTGYSSICMAQALPEDGKLIACDTSEEWTAIAQQYWRKAAVSHKIELRLAPALETLDELISSEVELFDFVFIDADKQNYSHYYAKSYQLTKPGGVIAVDNVLWGGGVIDSADNSASTRAIRELNHQIMQDDRVDLCMLPLADGLTLVRKR